MKNPAIPMMIALIVVGSVFMLWQSIPPLPQYSFNMVKAKIVKVYEDPGFFQSSNWVTLIQYDDGIREQRLGNLGEPGGGKL